MLLPGHRTRIPPRHKERFMRVKSITTAIARFKMQSLGTAGLSAPRSLKALNFSRKLATRCKLWLSHGSCMAV